MKLQYSARKMAASVVATVPLLALAGAAHASFAIGGGATTNVTCASHVCTATSSNAVLSINKLQSMLAGSSVKVISGSIATDIEIDAALTWVSSNTLTLDSYRSITVNRPVSVTGSGGLTLTTNDGGSGGNFSFGEKGNVSFWSLSSPLTINGDVYKLVDDIATLAADILANRSGSFALANSYDASVDGVYSQSPIDNDLQSTKLEGLGNTIANVTVVASSAGTTSFVTRLDGGMIENLRLAKISISNPGQFSVVGGLVGFDNGMLRGDSVNGTITGGPSSDVGGLVGQAEGGNGDIENSTATGVVSGGDFAHVGGLVGFTEYSAIITNSHTDNRVAGGNSTAVGGLVGRNTQAEILDSYANGNIRGGIDSYVGGLVGVNASSIISVSYATGAVFGRTNSQEGGLVGFNAGSSVRNSYSTGPINGAAHSEIGGLVGYNGGTLDTVYSTGAVTAGRSSVIGGLVGVDSGGIGHGRWDTTTSGITVLSQGAGNVSHDPGVVGLSTVQFQAALPPGFSAAIWGEAPSVNSGLPYLLANPPPG